MRTVSTGDWHEELILFHSSVGKRQVYNILKAVSLAAAHRAAFRKVFSKPVGNLFQLLWIKHHFLSSKRATSAQFVRGIDNASNRANGQPVATPAFPMATIL